MISEFASGEEKLSALKLQYDISRAELIKPIRELQKNYKSQLEKLRDEVRASGSLEKTKAVDEELKGYLDCTSPPADRDFPDLRRLQTIYATEATGRYKTALRDLPPLVSSYRTRLEQLQKTLTQKDMLDEAEEVKKALAQIDETLGVTVPSPPSIGRPANPAVIEFQGPTKPFATGELQFTNRDFVWKNVPSEYVGWEMMMRAGGSETDAKITVKTPGLVYSVIGPTFEKQFRQDDWKKVKTLYGGPDGKQDYLIMEKVFEPGEHTVSGKGWFTTRILLPPSSQRK